jgi:hypothetical protein
MEYPLTVLLYELVEESGGAGRFPRHQRPPSKSSLSRGKTSLFKSAQRRNTAQLL